jgi:beta-glucosidase
MTDMAEFVDALLARMSVAEKIGQLNLVNPGGEQLTGSSLNTGIENKLRAGLIGAMFGTSSMDYRRRVQEIALRETRAKIPVLFASDVIHGYRTALPLPLALSCTWDLPLLERSAHIAATEARADGIDLTFAPMVDVARDPRWGRVAEGAGESPYLGAKIAAAMVKGFQGDPSGDNLADPDRVMACVKHFVAYGAPEGGREYAGLSIGPEDLHELHLPPFKAAIDAGVGSLMPAFNTVNTMPVTGDRRLLTGLLRELWDFNGFIVTDYTAVNELVNHGLGDLAAVSALALDAGVDMDMVGEGFLNTLPRSLECGAVTEQSIDEACRRILIAKWKLGLFADPFKFLDPQRAKRLHLCPQHRREARGMAARSCVLLKNDGKLLPLPDSGTLALIGPLADDQKNMQGTWAVSTNPNHSVSVRSAMSELAGSELELIYAKGANITDDPVIAKRLNVFSEIAVIDPRPADELIAEAVAAAQRSDRVVAVVGEAKEHSGECASRTELDIPASQRRLLGALKQTGKPLVVVVMAGRPLTLQWEYENADALLLAWFGGTEAGGGIADVLFGAYNPAAKLTMTFPVNVGQIPIYHDQLPTGRPLTDPDANGFEKFKSCYLDVGNRPLFPFGYGLSYTSFDYSAVTLNKTAICGDDTLVAEVTVTNSGDRAGEEIVQLYLSDPVASRSRPVITLKAFEKIALEPGEKRRVSFELKTDDLEFVSAESLLELRYDWQPGEFVVHIGPNSQTLNSARLTWDKSEPKSSTIKLGLSDEALLDLVQRQTLRYFWEYGHPVSGLARERTLRRFDTVTTGGSGFGIMAMLAGAERGWLPRAQVLERIQKIVDFLYDSPKYRGAFPHWLNGASGATLPFSKFDDGGDLVETSFLMMGMLCARQYFAADNPAESALRQSIDRLWHGVNWDGYVKDGKLCWHWSARDGGVHGKLPIGGWNECLITYVLAAASPTHAIDPEVYRSGWTTCKQFRNARNYYDIELPLGPNQGGPLFFAHYSFLGLDPDGLKDQFTDYWTQNRNHVLINRAYCVDNPKGFQGYSEECWGLTASDNPQGYSAHHPGNDNGTITPTAALASMPYTPEESLRTMRYFYERLGDRIWSDYGFVDAFNITQNWYAKSHLAIDQGPIVVMIENYRSRLLWRLFMSCPEVKHGLQRLGFDSPHLR